MNPSLSQIGAQFRTLWNHLGLNQRVTLVAAVAVVFIGLVGLSVWSSRVDYALLYGGLAEGEAAKVVAALDDLKVPYRITRGGGAIQAPADKVHYVRMQLAGKGIPRSGDGVGFEIFDKPNFGISDFVQRANYLRAVQGELARTISQVDSVESARVMIVMPENRLLVDNSKRPTASIFIKVRGNSQLPPQTINAIRFLVANSVEGLQPNFVSIVDNLGNVLSENNADDSIAGLTTTQLAARKNLELYLSKKGEGMLERVLGPGQAVVRVSAEINFDTVSRTEEKFDPEGQVIRISTINDENTDTATSSSNGGVPGVRTNAGNDTNSTAAATSLPVNSSTTKKKVANNQYEINKTTSTLLQAAGGVTRVSAAVFVAAKMEGTGENRKVAPRSPEELDKLRRIVQSALGIQQGADSTRQDIITLEEMPFNDQPDQELTRTVEKQEMREFWWNLAGKAFYPLLAFGVLFFFWRTLRRTPGEMIPIGVPLSQMAYDTSGFVSVPANGNGNHRTKGNGVAANGRNGGQEIVSVDVLNQLIRENPDNVTQAIRSWMTRGKNNK